MIISEPQKWYDLVARLNSLTALNEAIRVSINFTQYALKRVLCNLKCSQEHFNGCFAGFGAKRWFA